MPLFTFKMVGRSAHDYVGSACLTLSLIAALKARTVELYSYAFIFNQFGSLVLCLDRGRQLVSLILPVGLVGSLGLVLTRWGFLVEAHTLTGQAFARVP